MATTSSPDAPQQAPWKYTFLEHLNKMDRPEFVFSSIHPAPKGSSTPYVPRARYCIFRGFWAELPENKHNEAEMNDRVYESDLPTFTTDVRMNKPFELFSSSSGRAEDPSQAEGSGGGGPCEAVWWIKDVMVQWRVKGQAFVVAPDIENAAKPGEESSGVRTVKSEIGARMRVLEEDKKEEWSWDRELTAHFGNVAPGMRGTFAQPPPGQPVDQPYDENLKMGEQIKDLHHSIARSNFRVVIIRPEEVESIDLSDPAKARRQVYQYDEASGQWSHDVRWP